VVPDEILATQCKEFEKESAVNKTHPTSKEENALLMWKMAR